MTVSDDRILFQDASYLAVAKLAGELVVKGKGAVGKLPLLDFLRKTEPGLHPVNRLDFETSGIVLFARTKAALAAAVASMKGGQEWEKTYVALVAGVVRRDQGEITLPLPSRTRGEKIPAHTRYRVRERYANSTLVEVVITTGRQHQIRRHFAAIGHPLALDQVYGDARFNRTFSSEFRLHRFFLHACGLRFEHPITHEQVRLECPMPPAFERILKELRKTA